MNTNIEKKRIAIAITARSYSLFFLIIFRNITQSPMILDSQ